MLDCGEFSMCLVTSATRFRVSSSLLMVLVTAIQDFEDAILVGLLGPHTDVWHVPALSFSVYNILAILHTLCRVSLQNVEPVGRFHCNNICATAGRRTVRRDEHRSARGDSRSMRAAMPVRRWKGTLVCHGDCHVLGAMLVRKSTECWFDGLDER